MSHRLPKIAVFDSGIGGLSIVRELKNLSFSCELRYLMDNANLPYGNKSESWVKNRSLDIANDFVKNWHPDILLVACNTASTIALPELRKHLQIPVVGVVPAIKVAAQLSQTGCIGLLATKATVARAYVDELVAQFAPKQNVVRFAAQAMVEWAEAAFLQEEFAEAELQAMLQDFFTADPQNLNMDIVVLGCTHFVFLLPHLQRLAPRAVQWIDSAAAVARRVRHVLEVDCAFHGRLHNSRPPVWELSYTSVSSPQAALQARMGEFGFAKLTQVSIGI